ncbi:MAG TPA: PRC-barrel domain-containing protein [Candidatus Acidoferrum sp.]|nr:PRC-barrel domain-containing protein [Candidatus Acidoferrum sp.]
MAQELGNIRGRKVISADALEIGGIVDIIVETVAWRVESLQVKVRKEAAEKIGVNRGIFHGGTFNLPVELIQSVGDSIVLSASSTELRNSLVQAKSGGGKIAERRVFRFCMRGSQSPFLPGSLRQ